MTQSSLPSRWLITSPQFANDPDIFPLLPGFSFITSKEPTWSTGIQQATSGRERRRMLWSYPLWNFNVGYEVLRDAPSYAEQQKLLAFFNSHAGRYQGFFFYDPSDNAATNSQFSTGDGGTTVYPLYRIVGNPAISSIYWLEPIRALYGGPQPFIAGMPCNLVRNGGFELQTGGQPYGWGAYSAPTIVWTGPTGRSGSGLAVGIRATAAGSGVFGIVSYVGVNPGAGITGGVTGQWNPGQTYTASFWARKVNGSAFTNMQMGWNRAPATFAANLNPTLSTSWQRYSFTFTWGDTTGTLPGELYLTVSSPATISSGDELLIDDLQVTQGPDLGGSAAASSFSISAPGQITFDTAPANGTTLTWTGQYLFPVRFADDKLTAKQLMQGLWSAEGINLVGVKV